MKQRVILLGSTGSIGKQSLEVLAMHSDQFELLGISAGHDTELLREQTKQWKPSIVACGESLERSDYPDQTELWCGEDASERLAAVPCDIVIVAISGFAALRPVVNAIRHTKRIAIANKESLVCGGSFVTRLAAECGAEFLPIDSEQSAVFQCLRGGRLEDVRQLILTASGGPFFRKSREELKNVSLEQVLSHPTWNMGKKITLDSATMFNKGLEIIEASRLFGFDADHIDVLIHPQSIVHSMVEFIDGSVIANMAVPDMRLPIQYALTYPERILSPARPLDLSACGSLSFFKADRERFPALRMAYEALRQDRGYPIVYNGANEMTAKLYFDGAVRFDEIEGYVQAALDAYNPHEISSVDDIMAVDRWSRSYIQLTNKRLSNS